MANRYASLDPTWAHRPAPAPARAAAGHCHSTSAWLFPAAAFENEALTSALRASMSPASATNAAAASSSSSYPTTPSSSSTSELPSGGHDAPAAGASSPGRRPLARQAAAGPKAGRVTKRKPRPSTRRPPPVTYVTAGPADFRRMVQQITGYFPVGGARHHQATAAPTSSWPAAPAPPACAATLPTLDTSAFLLDHHPAVAAAPAAAGPGRLPDDKSSTGVGAMAEAVVTAAAVEYVDHDDSSVLRELEAMATFAPPAFGSEFPTLESWGII